MIVTDIDMNLVEGKYRPSVALNLWTGFLRARPELQAVVHTHSPHATAFAVTGKPIPVVTETQADWFGQPVPVTPYLSVEDPRFASLPVELMGDGFAVLLGQHGVITVGSSLAHALERAVTLEEAAHTYLLATNLGTPLILSEAQARASFDYYHNRYGQRGGKKPE
jgi:L-ribulose-5-phosphate 4-epimerase